MRLDVFFPVSYPMARYEFSDEKSSKFWEIKVTGTSYTVQYGNIGTTGQTQSKTFFDAKEAKLQSEKAAISKLKKGYVLVSGKGPAIAPAPKKKKKVTKRSAPEPVSGGNSDMEAAIFENPEDLGAWAVSPLKPSSARSHAPGSPHVPQPSYARQGLSSSTPPHSTNTRQGCAGWPRSGQSERRRSEDQSGARSSPVPPAKPTGDAIIILQNISKHLLESPEH